jgi:hypothetical protein
VTTPDFDPIVEWFRHLLYQGTGRGVGDSEAPDGRPFPYAVVHLIGATFDGPGLYAPDADAAISFQVDSVGRTVKSARWLSDRARLTVLARDSGSFQVKLDPPAGYEIVDRSEDGGPQAPSPGGNQSDRLWTVSERFVIHTTPGD